MTARPRRVLQICEATNAGVGRHTIDLCEGLLAAGCDVHLLYSTGRIDETFRDHVRTMPRLRSEIVEMTRLPHPRDAAVVAAVRRYIDRHGPFDILHGQSSKGGGIARLAGVLGRTPVIYTPNCISTMAPTFGPLSRWVNGWIEWALSFPTAMIICTSPDEYEHIQELGIPRDKLRLVYYGIEPPPETDRSRVRASLGLPDDALIVGFVGRLEAQKNPAMLVRAFAAAAEGLPDARLAMIGVGEQQGELTALAEKLGVASRIDWLGYRRGYPAMPAFDILAVPSRYDTGPIVMMEAMALGVPLVITEVGCVRQVMADGRDGYVLAPDDVEGMARRLGELMRSPETRARFAAAAMDKAVEFRRETMVRRTLAAYDDASS